MPGRPRVKEPLSHVIRVRVTASTHRRAALAAAKNGLDVSVYVREALHQRLEREAVKE